MNINPVNYKLVVVYQEKDFFSHFKHMLSHQVQAQAWLSVGFHLFQGIEENLLRVHYLVDTNQKRLTHFFTIQVGV